MDEEAKRRLKIVRENYIAFNNGDIDGVMRPMHPEIEVIVADENSRLVPGQHYSGAAEVRKFFAEIQDTVGLTWVDVQEMTAAETSVIARVTIHGQIRESGQEGAIPAVHRYTFEGVEIVRIETFRPDWRAQIG